MIHFSQAVATVACEGASGCCSTTPGQLQPQHLWLLITLPMQLQLQYGSEPLVVDSIAHRQLQQQQHNRKPPAFHYFAQAVATAALKLAPGL